MSAPHDDPPLAVTAADVAPNQVNSLYPPPFAERMALRQKRKLGDVFGLSHFGVNLARIEPGGISSLRHCHDLQDEFIYILAGHPIINSNNGPVQLAPGMCAGFKGGTGQAHNLENPGSEDVWYLEVGDRNPGDKVHYPDEDLMALQNPEGAWVFCHKDGTPYRHE